MKIVLVGYMGSGKTTIGKLLAKELVISFLDLDEVIEEGVGDSISNIFKGKGEIFFRNMEHEYLNNVLSQKNNIILSTGGGTPCYSGNMETMLALADHVFYLKISIPGLVKRLIKEKDHRPLIKNIDDGDLPEFIGKHLFERNNYYLKATHIIECDNKFPETLVAEIQQLLG
ncbi:shikimate kinase [Arenibacter sp. N53]|uniref:shikimate kinase n=1 Tax=Arenibacter TaxID=178469 RepID=UPI000CD3D06E|nr:MULTISPECIES: shikimate kinase [Arenibacter]MCM4154173.1 shikimate kinase [Arenibacter sp. N53]